MADDFQNIAFQDQYPEMFSHCFGCGRSHPDGLHLKSHWETGEAAGEPATLAVITPPSRYCGGVPGHIYGGMIASIFDCHGTASAAAFACRAEGRAIGDWQRAENPLPPVRYVTASLKVDFLRPTPQGVPLTVRACLVRQEGRKVELAMALKSGDILYARAEMLAVRFQENPSAPAAVSV
jgi:acyl-coenzyme A thioesterase PaaI-like protein